MKKILLATLIPISSQITGQNLIPNGDFEQYSACPSNFSQINYADFWMNPSTGTPTSGSPDYYHQCATNFNLGVPFNTFTYQPARSGAAYAGCYITRLNTMANVREYLEANISQTLQAGACYRFQMYINLANTSMYTTDDFGIYFSDTAVTGVDDYLPLPFPPQIVNTAGNFVDSLNWMLMEGFFYS